MCLQSLCARELVVVRTAFCLCLEHASVHGHAGGGGGGVVRWGTRVDLRTAQAKRGEKTSAISGVIDMSALSGLPDPQVSCTHAPLTAYACTSARPRPLASCSPPSPCHCNCTPGSIKSSAELTGVWRTARQEISVAERSSMLAHALQVPLYRHTRAPIPCSSGLSTAGLGSDSTAYPHSSIPYTINALLVCVTALGNVPAGRQPEAAALTQPSRQPTQPASRRPLAAAGAGDRGI